MRGGGERGKGNAERRGTLKIRGIKKPSALAGASATAVHSPSWSPWPSRFRHHVRQAKIDMGERWKGETL